MNYWDVFLDALYDTLKILPILLIVYFLIEFLEYKNVFKFEKSNLLKGKYSPIMGALFGCVPQCGFSVLSTELFSEDKISIGALIAVYISTSDEALPIMIANYNSIPALCVLIVVKIILGIIIGYLSYFLYGVLFKEKDRKVVILEKNKVVACTEKSSASLSSDTLSNVNENNATSNNENCGNNRHLTGCCNHSIEANRFEWEHPLVHSLKIILFIFIVNVIMGTIIYFVGEEKLMDFLSSSYAFQPVLALIIGLIPNCASSVVLTELFLKGGLSFGAIVTGLSVNAGLGLIMLFKENKNVKQNLFIILMLIIPSLMFGYILHFLPIHLI
jgi:hypothetical protein